MNVKVHVTSATVIAVLFVFSGCAHVERVNTPGDLVNSKAAYAYVFSRPMLEAMHRLGIEEDKKFGLQSECTSQYKTIALNVWLLQPMEFPEGKQHPTKGVWKSSYQLERCGVSKLYNALFIANSHGDLPMPSAYYPGETNASPQLVQDAMVGAVAVANVRSGFKDCKTFYVFDMRVTAPAHNVIEGAKTFLGVWNEAWTISVCGTMVDVAMTFIPDDWGGGTTWVIEKVQMGDTTGKP